MSKRKPRRKYLFSIKNINIDNINTKYGLILQSNINNKNIENPKNTTMITDLIEKTETKFISFLDETKRKKICSVSMIDFQYGDVFKNKNKYKCFWDKELIPDDIIPIGCPIKYIPHEMVKKYFSEISQDNYMIKESITETKKSNFKIDDDRLEIVENGFYETDGIFCSFNCCIAYIEDNYHNKIYNNSKQLLYKMYNEMCDKKVREIESAPHYRKLIHFGGDLTIKEYRDSFSKVIFENWGMVKPVKMVSVGYAYEKKFIF
jgi:hypothetical protein